MPGQTFAAWGVELEAELAALKARRCETCEANDKQYCPIPTRSNIIAARPSFSCSEWKAREDGES
jgi:hypothetical protein